MLHIADDLNKISQLTQSNTFGGGAKIKKKICSAVSVTENIKKLHSLSNLRYYWPGDQKLL